MWAVGSAVLVLTAVAYVRVPVLPDLGDELSMSVADLGLVTTVFAAGRLCADIPAGRLTDLRSPRSMLAGAAVLLGAASMGLASAPGIEVVLLSAFFLGVSSAVVNTTGMVWFAEASTVERRGRSMAGFSAALLGGQAVGPAVGGLLASLLEWRGALVVGGGLGLVAGALIAVRRRRPGGPAQPEAAPAEAIEDVTRRLYVRERAILYFVPFAMFFTFGSMPQTLVPIIGADEFELSVGVIGLVLGLGGVCRFIGAVVGGVVSDRFSRKAALVPSLLLQAVGVGLLAWEEALWAWVAAVVVMSLASFSISAAATMLVDRSPEGRAGRRLGPFRFVGDIGLISGPLLASLVYESFGQRPAAGMVACVLLVAAVASALGLRETRWLAGPDSTPSRREEVSQE